MPFCSPLLNICGGNCNSQRDSNHAELRQASLRFPRIEESARSNGQNGTLNGYAQRPSVMRTNLVDSFPPATGEELLQQHIEYRRRSGRLLRISAEDVARMVTDFAASHGGITRYPPTYAAPSCQYRIKPPMVGKTSRRLGSEAP
jgi:hypothetical protein